MTLWRITIPVAVVLVVASFGIWVALHPREVLRGGYAYTPTDTSHRPERIPDDRIYFLKG